MGGIRITMPDLVSCLKEIGLDSPRTYLQTGNVIGRWSGTKAELKSSCELALTKRFGYEAYVVVFDQQELEEAISSYPWGSVDSSIQSYVILSSTEESVDCLVKEGVTLVGSEEKLAAGTLCVYWQVPKGETTTRAFGKFASKPRFKATTTMRNLNTLHKMAASFVRANQKDKAD